MERDIGLAGVAVECLARLFSLGCAGVFHVSLALHGNQLPSPLMLPARDTSFPFPFPLSRPFSAEWLALTKCL